MSDAKCLFKGTDDDDDDDDNRRDGYSDTLTHTHTHPRMNDLAFQPPRRQLCHTPFFNSSPKTTDCPSCDPVYSERV